MSFKENEDWPETLPNPKNHETSTDSDFWADLIYSVGCGLVMFGSIIFALAVMYGSFWLYNLTK